MNSPAEEKILVFIPMYRCEKQIGRVLEKVYAHAQGLVEEIFIVDNRSPDQSCAAALNAMGEHPPIPTTLVINTQNYSLGGSHKVAFKYAAENKFTHVIALHGDDQADIRDFIPRLKNGEHRKVDALLGSRFTKEASLHGYSRFRIFGNLVLNSFFSLCCRRVINDMGSGLNLFGPQIIYGGDIKKTADDLTFNCYLLLAMIGNKRAMRFVPIHWYEEDQVSNAKLFRQAWKITRLLIRYVTAPTRLMDEDHSTQEFVYTYEIMRRKTPA